MEGVQNPVQVCETLRQPLPQSFESNATVIFMEGSAGLYVTLTCASKTWEQEAGGKGGTGPPPPPPQFFGLGGGGGGHRGHQGTSTCKILTTS